MRKILFTILVVLLSAGCIGQGSDTPEIANPQTQNKLIMATTTSTYDSGLLGVLNPTFQKKCNCIVEVISTGTGAAIKIAKDGDTDLIFVHEKPSSSHDCAWR